MGIIIVLGAIVLYYICNLYFTGDKVNKSIENRKYAEKRGELSYFDYNANSDRMVSSGRKVRRLISHDKEGRMFEYYLDRSTGTFINAQYFGTKNCNEPIQYRDIDVQHWLSSGAIKSEKDLYR